MEYFERDAEGRASQVYVAARLEGCMESEGNAKILSVSGLD